MKISTAIPIGMALSMVALAACQKPAAPNPDTATAAASSATQDASSAPASATASVAAPGGVVSPPQPNGAVNPDANRTTADAAPASNSFTQGQAKGHIENAGYTDVTDLQKTKDGLWVALAKKDGKSVGVTVDFKGAVTAN